MLSLPTDVSLLLASFLAPEDLGCLGRVCSRLWEVSRTDSLWLRHCKPGAKKRGTWRSTYVRSRPRKKLLSKDGYCPRCGSLVVRKNTHYSRGYEQFYGCDNYPACRFSQSVPPPPVVLEELGPRVKRAKGAGKTLEQLDLFALKGELRKRKLSTKGRKQELVERLREVVAEGELFQ